MADSLALKSSFENEIDEEKCSYVDRVHAVDAYYVCNFHSYHLLLLLFSVTVSVQLPYTTIASDLKL